MAIRTLHRHLHEVDFIYSDKIKEYESYIFREYEEFLKKDLRGNDFFINNRELSDWFNQKLNKIVKKYYHVSSPFHDNLGLRAYIQTNTPTNSFFHSHIHQPGVICGVMYYNIPKEGGEFEIFDSPHEPPFKIKPKLNKVYFFPNWLYHRPTPQKDDISRICLNWIYNSNVRPISKNLGEKW